MGLYGLALTFASIDWVMSLEPHWFSSIFGVLFGAGQLLSGLSFCIIVVLMLADRPPYRGALVPGHLRDLGSLLLAFVMLWAYLSVSQLILIWSANLKEEAPYYVVRASGGWQYVVTLVVLLQFVAPFLILLTRDGKRNPQRLLIVAGMILVTRLVDLFWVIAPARDLDGHGRHVAWTDPIAVLALGGLWLALYLWELGRRPLLPVHADTSVQEDHHA
jgi:Ni/Fe-hydrogenase subunit HybB-like protein